MAQRNRRPVDGKRQKVPMTYYRSNDDVRSSPFSSNKKSVKPKKYIFGAIDLLIVVLLLAAFIYSLKVDNKADISISSQAYRPPTAYQAVAKTELQKVKNSNKLSINETEIINNLKISLPEISSGKLELPLISHQPKLLLNISPPAMVLSSQGRSYIISRDGVNVGDRSEFARQQDVPEVIDQSNYQLNKGKQALGRDEAEFIAILWQKAHSTNIGIESLVLTNKPMELVMYLKQEPYFVKFHTGGEPAIQIGQFLAAKRQFESTNNKPSEYLDVRVQGKIFYK